MNEIQSKLKYIFILILFVIFIFGFPNPQTYGYEIHYEDEGPDVEDESTKWYFTYYSDGNGGLGHINPLTGSSFVQEDWQVNETYGWHEWTYNGVTYVVMAAATLEGLDELPNSRYPFIDRQDNIHYFHYGTADNDWNYSTFQFQFVDNDDTTIYNGIVLDTCELALDPSDPKWDELGYGAKPENTQWLDVHVPIGYPETSKYAKFNGKEIRLTSTGTFSSSAGTTSTTRKKELLLELLAKGLGMAGDFLQLLINSLETSASAVQLTYTQNEIKAKNNLAEAIQLEDAGSEIETETIKTINISDKIDNEAGNKVTVFTADTEIPVIPIDAYTSSIDQLQLFDINFFDTTNENSNKYWRVIRNVVSVVSHSVLYIAAALLITMLIWRSILFVKSSLGDDPEGAAESRKMIDNWVKAIFLISIVYVIMTLLMYLYKNVLSIILNGNETLYPIRLNVENVYSFNTNYIGYFKYMSLQADVLASLKYSFIYFLMTWFVMGPWCLFMLARTIIIGGLIMVAPLVAVTAMREKSPKKGFNLTNILQFNNWLKTYLIWLWIPLIVVIIYRIVLQVG